MHSKADIKPIGKCKGCPLNLRDQCAVFQYPHEEWSHGHCKGYMNDVLHAHYLEERMQPHEKSHKEIRQKKMADLKTIEHQDGILNPGGSRW